MTVNAHPEYIAAEKEYLSAESADEKIKALEKMISHAPAHKGGENLRANLRTRYKKFKESLEKSKKSGKSNKETIKKEIMQCVLVGFANSGKTSVFQSLTGQGHPTSNAFSTQEPEPGMMNYHNAQIQIIDTPSFPNHDLNIMNTTDTIILVIDSLDQIKTSEEFTSKLTAKKIILYNKSDSLDEEQKRKIISFLQSKKYNFVLFSSFTLEGLEELKKKIFESFPIIRIYLKEPKKPASNTPMILKPESSVKDVAEKIYSGFSKKVKQTKIWGPSSKFSGQSVGLSHILKDKDIVEFQTS